MVDGWMITIMTMSGLFYFASYAAQNNFAVPPTKHSVLNQKMQLISSTSLSSGRAPQNRLVGAVRFMRFAGIRMLSRL